MALPLWQHHKHCLGYYYYYIIIALHSPFSRPTSHLRCSQVDVRRFKQFMRALYHCRRCCLRSLPDPRCGRWCRPKRWRSCQEGVGSNGHSWRCACGRRVSRAAVLASRATRTPCYLTHTDVKTSPSHYLVNPNNTFRLFFGASSCQPPSAEAEAVDTFGTSPLLPKVTKTSLWLLQTSEE